MNNINAIWVQNEKANKMEYMFYGNQLLKEVELSKIKYVRKILFNNLDKKIIWKDVEYSQSSIFKFDKGYILTGVLQSTDDLNRKLPFMAYVTGKDDTEISEYIVENLSKIGLVIDNDLVNQLLQKKDKSFLSQMKKIFRINRYFC